MQGTPPSHAPMPPFPIENGELVIGGIPLSRLAQRAGGTPFYAYDRALIRDRIAATRAILPAQFRLHYAIKANPLPALLGFVAPLVDGFDVASAGELKIALDAGMPAQDIGFAGPGKREAELRSAVAAGVLVSAESASEVDTLADIGRATGWPARLALRINPEFELKGSGMRMGGGAKPFGIDQEQVAALLADCATRAGLDFEGFHIYGGSQSLNPQALATALRAGYDAVADLARTARVAPRSINLGGGFGIPYFPGERRLDPAPIAQALAEIADDARAHFPRARLILELGRYLVGEAGLYVTRVVERKISRGKTFLVTDGGLNHHLAASGNFGQVLRKNYPLLIGNRMNAAVDTEPVSVVGPLCTPLDILGADVSLPTAVPGDFVVVLQSGAYGATASPQAFLGHPPVKEILV